MKDALTNLVKNWKTTLSGLLTLILLIAYLNNSITFEQMGVASVTLMSLGLMAAKDGNVTGTAKNPSN